MNTIGDAIAYAGAGVSYIAETIKYYVLGVPPAIPDDDDIVFVNGVTEIETLHGMLNIVIVDDNIVRLDEPETEPVTEPVTEPDYASAEPDDEPFAGQPAMPPSLAVRVAYHFVLDELLDTKGQTDL